MTQYRSVSLDLPDDVVAALGSAADAAGCQPSDYLYAVLRVILSNAPARAGGEEEVIRREIHQSSDWLELQRRLRARGYVLRRVPDGGLAIHTWPRDRAILRVEDLGYSSAGLVLKFGAAFPGDLSGARRARLAPPPAA
ncbi:hypothetical protein OEZ71_08760 [Defluviimonas sp. WL0050]|uniref:CopG family transcriptional regulator n=1 Tax=Albidovulum litorale TaxID=2984134 RepID=A0ABT2ZMM0_9RHOB|nr:hypothetical protein [Defluviimonas sp. WL0050]MCV2872384.1 hypothetical protein [Defluviimonas sp. WL0050]